MEDGEEAKEAWRHAGVDKARKKESVCFLLLNQSFCLLWVALACPLRQLIKVTAGSLVTSSAVCWLPVAELPAP